jgi:hypothetical protein
MYSDLVITAFPTATSTCSSLVLADTTGLYPEKPGGYSETTGTATRPTLAETQRWTFYRRRNADATWTEFVPSEQNNSDPYEFSISLVGQTDSAWELFIVVVPIALNYAELLDEGYDLEQFVTLGLDSGAAGLIGYYDNCVGNNCLNFLQQKANNEYPDECKIEAFQEVQAWIQSATDNIAVGGGVQPSAMLSPSTTLWFTQAAVEIEKTLSRCAEPNCGCGC